MTRKNAVRVRHLSCQKSRALFISLCCCSLTAVSALQAQSRHSRSFFSPRPLLSSETTTTSKGSKRRRQRHESSLSSSFDSQEHDVQDDTHGIGPSPGLNRREVFSNSAKALFAGLATPFLLDPTDPANALLLRFPVDAPNTQPLKNKYHFMRAGTSELEAEGIYSTNPMFLTNRENQMSPKGYECLKEALSILKKTPCQPTVAYHSLAANGMDTGDLIARELKLGRDRLLPEFTYLDQRGIGLWDSNDEALVRPAVWAMDALEAGTEGFGGRPPANDDGTPNDTLHDQFTRLRQFLSLQETRTSGEIILVIFPDGTGPALLSCMIAGIPYSEAHTLEYKPGELRLDITSESIREMYEQRKDDPAYLEIIEQGKENLKELRQMKAKDFSVSLKDSRAIQDTEDAAFYENQEAARAEKLREAEERRAKIQEQLQISQEKARLKEEQRQEDLLAAKEKKEQKLREQKELAERRKSEQQAIYVERKQQQALSQQKQAEARAAAEKKKAESQAASRRQYEEAQAGKKENQLDRQAAVASGSASGTVSGPSESSLFGMSPAMLATVAAGAIGAVFLSGTEDEDGSSDYSEVTAKKADSGGDGSAAERAPISKVVREVPKVEPAASVMVEKKEEKIEKKQPQLEPMHSAVTAKKVDSVIDKNVDKATPVPAAVKHAAPTPKVQTTAPVTSHKKEVTKKKGKPKLKLMRSMKTNDTGSDVNASKPASVAEAAQQEKPFTQETSSSGNWRKKRKKPTLKPLKSTVDAKKDETTVPPKKAPTGPKKAGGVATAASKANEDEFTAKMKAAEQEMKDAFVEAAGVKKKKQQQQQQQEKQHRAQKSPATHAPPKKKSSLFDNNPPVIVTKTVPQTTNYVYDDDEDDSAWLNVLAEIRDEADDDDEDDSGMVDHASLMNDAQR